MQPFYMVGFEKYNENHDAGGRFDFGSGAPASLKGMGAADLHGVLSASKNPDHSSLDRARTRLAKQSKSGQVSTTTPGAAASALREPDGGFTYNTISGETAQTGFSVSVHPELSETVDIRTMSDPELKTSIQNYSAKNAVTLAQPGNFLGGWHDPDTGIGYLDVAHVVSRAQDARKLAAQNDQIAYFDFQTGTSVDVNRSAKSGQK